MNTGLQGGVRFPTGGIVREHLWMPNRCNSDTDSKRIFCAKSGWKKTQANASLPFYALNLYSGRYFLINEVPYETKKV
jgi:hypothetical protein